MRPGRADSPQRDRRRSSSGGGIWNAGALELAVLDDPERGTARSLVLQLTGTARAELDTVHRVELALAAQTWRVCLPLTIR